MIMASRLLTGKTDREIALDTDDKATRPVRVVLI
jgi:hypothetical protein